MTHDTSCWELHGVRGSGDCPRLREVGHCRHCEVLIAAGRARLDAPFDESEQQAWSDAAQSPPPQHERHTLWLTVAVNSELLALPAGCIAAVQDYVQPHRLPRQREGALCGAIGWMGRLAPAACLSQIMGGARQCEPRHTLLLELEGELWAVCVEKALGVAEVPEHESGGVFVWRDEPVRCIDTALLATRLREAMQ